jgi:bifunctional non-homologous end joining protein LigD
VFDVMILGGRDVRHEPLTIRRELLVEKVLPKLAEPVRHLAPLDATLPVLIQSVKTQGFEGLTAKRRDSGYESGQRSGAWLKLRVNQAQEFVIGGYTRGVSTFDALVFGYYDGDRLIYAGRTRSGFSPRHPHTTVQATPATRDERVPVRESAREDRGTLGTGTDEGEDGGLPVALTGTRRAVRISGVDGRTPFAPYQVHGAPRGQARQGRCSRTQDRPPMSRRR